MSKGGPELHIVAEEATAQKETIEIQGSILRNSISPEKTFRTNINPQFLDKVPLKSNRYKNI
jgi:hypothetical protein